MIIYYSLYNVVIIPKVYLMLETKKRDTNIPRVLLLGGTRSLFFDCIIGSPAFIDKWVVGNPKIALVLKLVSKTHMDGEFEMYELCKRVFFFYFIE